MTTPDKPNPDVAPESDEEPKRKPVMHSLKGRMTIDLNKLRKGNEDG